MDTLPPPATGFDNEAFPLRVPPSKPKVSEWRRFLYLFAGAACVAFISVLTLLLVFENSLIFPAPKYPAGDWNAQSYQAEDVYFTSADGTKLHGWLLAHPEPKAYVLYCHGNGDCVGYHGGYLAELRERLRVSIFTFDYRGYGRSEGSPFEAGVMQDAVAARDWLATRMGVPKQDIVLFGRSLGGAVAVDLAARDGARGLILQSTFSSMPEVAARMYPFLPVRALMRSQFNSAEKIGRYHGPLLQSHGTHDTLIPAAMGRKLFDLAPGPKQFFEVSGGGHNDPEPESYNVVLEAFLERI